MCGIGGVLYFDGERPSFDILVRMTSALAHRGPDGLGHEILGSCGLAHRRLSIIDLSDAGHQPMSTSDGELWIAYNGEIYNYVELREELEALGHRFRSHTDTEVVLCAYRQWREGAFSRFNGMWALAIWDRSAQRLLLSRDRFGVKPLYLHRSAKRMLFASEVKGLLSAEPHLSEPDDETITRHLMLASLCYSGRSFFRGIFALPPGTNLIVEKDGRTREERFWSFSPIETKEVGMREGADRVRELLVDSIRLRFRSDVRVGTCLSGGIDSSAIVAIANQKLGLTPESFSVTYSDPKYDETEFIRIMVKEFGLPGHEIAPDGTDLPEVLERATYFQDGPTSGAGLYSQWHVMKRAAGRVKVLLDGQGGDELFAGYFHDFLPYIESLIARVKQGDLRALSTLVQVYRDVEPLTGANPVQQLIRQRWTRSRPRRLAVRYAMKYGLRRSPVPAPRVMAPELDRYYHPEDREWQSRQNWSGDPLTDTLWQQMVRTSLPGLLHFEDRNSMAFSIEARVPFLDYRLVEYAFGLPFHLKMRASETKAVLRAAMLGILPEPIRARRDKKGYPTPFSTWVKDLHSDWLRDLILSDRALQRGYTLRAGVENLLDQHLNGLADHGSMLWRLATLELYCRRFIDQPFAIDRPADEPAPRASLAS
jgi:asparagine synthase (glutamine-hydrolysing)